MNEVKWGGGGEQNRKSKIFCVIQIFSTRISSGEFRICYQENLVGHTRRSSCERRGRRKRISSNKKICWWT